jgi:hypothetical protein
LKMERMARQCKIVLAELKTAMLLTFPLSKAYVSFGGLLLALEGPYKKLTPLRVDYVYLLIKK